MIKGSGDTSQLGGPIRIAKITGQVAEIGILPFISIMAYISISLGLINLFPIPMLDGGHLMFYAFEKVLGRPLSQKTQEGFFRIGMFLLVSLMFFTTFNDYYFARKYGVGVTDFSIGFGQEIFGWNDKHGTRWKICWIPLGGYVKFFGDRNVFSQADHEKILKQYNEEDQEKLFVIKPLYQRALIVFGGPLANFLLAIAIFFCIYTFVGKDFTPAVINEVQKDSPAMIGGLKDNDVILEIDGNKVESIMDVAKFITTSTGDSH